MFELNLLYPTPPGHTWVHVELELEAEAFEPADVRRTRAAVIAFCALGDEAVSVLDVCRWRPGLGLVLPIDDAFDLVRGAQKADPKWLGALEGLHVRTVRLEAEEARRYSIGGDPLDIWQNMDLKLEAFYAKASWQEAAKRLRIPGAPRAMESGRAVLANWRRVASLTADSVASTVRSARRPSTNAVPPPEKTPLPAPDPKLVSVEPKKGRSVELSSGFKRLSSAISAVELPASWRSRLDAATRLVDLALLAPQQGSEPIREIVWDEEIQERDLRNRRRMNLEDTIHLLRTESVLLFLNLTAWCAWLGGVVGAVLGLGAAARRWSGFGEAWATAKKAMAELPVDEEHKPLATTILGMLALIVVFFGV